MHRLVSRLLGYGVFLFPLLVAASVAGCTGSPIGDPCIPENIPQEDRNGDGFPDGFDSAEVYIETSSVQCRTRTCMVYALDGNPEKVTGDSCPAGDPTCVTPVALEAQVFCSCRCSLGPGASANTPLCNCGDGFTCVDDLVTTGGDGVVGGYCVPCIRAQNEDREGLAGVYDDCPTPGS